MTAYATRGPGPAAPVNARPGVGFASPEPWCVEVAPGADVRTWELPLDQPVQVRPGHELGYVVFPESASADQRRWESTYVCLDAVLDDGGLLSASGVVDQYGQALTPQAQGDGRRLWVDQWNLRRADLSALAGRRVERLLVAVRAGDLPLRIYVDTPAARIVNNDVNDFVNMATRSSTISPATPLDLVSTTRGTHSSDRFSRGNTAPLVGLPHGGVFGLPMTDASRGDWPYHYQADNRPSDNRPAIQAFATSHLPSPWMGDRGVFQVMPSPLADLDRDRTARASAFDHAEEDDGPHRYAVRFDDGMSAELVPGDFALSLRVGLPAELGAVILDHHGAVRSVSVETEGPETVVRALLDDREGMPPHHIHLRVPGVVADRTSYDGERLGGHLTVRADERGRVDVRLGISTVSDAWAEANLRAAGDHDRMAHRAREEWERVLSTVQVDGASHDRLVSLWSSLHRVFLYPNRYGEGPAQRHLSPYDLTTVRSGPMTTTHGFWDTYRTAWPLLALLEPAIAGELAEGFVEHFRDAGWTPRWSAPGAQDCMTGTTFDTVLGDLAVKDIAGIDLATGYASALKNATVPSDDVRVGRKGLRKGIFVGYVDTDTHEGLSWTLDNAINDWGASRLAAALRERGLGDVERLAAEEDYLARRALSYRSVFDTERGFFIGRTPSGDWRPGFDPDVWGHDYTETNAWGTAFTAPHDGAGLAALHGGEEALGEALDAFFARPETGAEELSGHYGFAIHEMTEARDVRMGMLGLSNQPAHHIPFMYMFAGRHDDAHRIVRECVDRLFVGSDLGQGYPGDEDNGEMSAWYVWAAIGLYPLVPASGTYVIVPPSVRRTVLNPLGVRRIVIETLGEGDHIASVSVDGEPWDEISISHARLAAGAHLVIELTREPRGWAGGSRPPSASLLTGHGGPLVDLATEGDKSAPKGDKSAPESDKSAGLTDDLGETPTELAAGESVVVGMRRSAPIVLYTVTSATPGTIGWRLEYLDEVGATTAVEERVAEPYEWAGQTRPFRVQEGEPVTAASVRFTASVGCTLTQIELLCEGPDGADDEEGR